MVLRLKNPRFADRRYLIGGSDARIVMGEDQAALLRLRREQRGEVEPGDPSGNLTVQRDLASEDLTPRWYGSITGRMSAGRYIVALCYATAVFLVGWWPWNVLLILPALPSNNLLRFGAFVPPEESVWSKVFFGRGGSL